MTGPGSRSTATIPSDCGVVKMPFGAFDPARRDLRMNRAVARFRKLFRVKRLYDVNAGGACRWEHRSQYRRA